MIGTKTKRITSQIAKWERHIAGAKSAKGEWPPASAARAQRAFEHWLAQLASCNNVRARKGLPTVAA